MKKLFTIVLLFIATLISLYTKAQPMVSKTAFDNPAILSQADSIRTVYEMQGFELSKASGMNMESENEVPVVFQMKEGVKYRIVFIGENTSKLNEVRMFDWNDKQVVYKKQAVSGSSNNIISYDYTSKSTEYHMAKPVQTNKKKEIGGYFMIFKKTV